jgi:hypothetical protein
MRVIRATIAKRTPALQNEPIDYRESRKDFEPVLKIVPT